MSSKSKGFRTGRERDSDEKHGHVTPLTTGASVNAPEGAWVDVPQGMVAVPDTYVDDDGVLRAADGGAVAIWHHRCKASAIRIGHGECERYTDKTKFLRADEIIYVNGAPWCPDCLIKMREDEKQEQKWHKVNEVLSKEKK